MNTLFFLLSKVFWTLVQPLSLLIILIGFAILALYRGRIGFARRVLVGVSCAFLLIGFFPIGNLVLEPLETRFSIQPDPPSPKTIIVL
ncbi:MAG: YdcF family protein, partial [Rhodobacteraceae bacterium]|nr:YdcF family protein [Paracoccaceae bacterium]